MSAFLHLPPIAVSQSSSLTTSLLVSQMQFGNGYISRRAEAASLPQRNWSVSWDALNTADYQTLEVFFASLKGITPFYWQAPHMTSSQLYLCQRWQSRPLAGNMFTLKADFISY